MTSATLDQSLFLIFFIYGLAFFSMGLAMTLESGRSPALAVGRLPEAGTAGWGSSAAGRPGKG
jgi:hypothetical protein